VAKENNETSTDPMPDRPPTDRPILRMCVNLRAGDKLPSCGARGSREMVAALTAGIEARGLPFTTEHVHCMGKCHIGPTVRMLPEGPWIMGMQEADVPRALELLEESKVEELAAEFPLPADDRDAEG